MIWQVITREVTCNKLEDESYKSEKKFIKEENKLRIENNVRLLADLIYLNFEHSNSKIININHIYKILYDTVNYTKVEEEKNKKSCLHIFKS